MKYYDDGRVGLSFEPSGGTLRFLPEPATGDHPPFDSVGLLTHLSDRVAKLSGLHGKLTIRHVWLLADVLAEMGVEVLYMERIGGHTVPFGQRHICISHLAHRCSLSASRASSSALRSHCPFHPSRGWRNAHAHVFRAARNLSISASCAST